MRRAFLLRRLRRPLRALITVTLTIAFLYISAAGVLAATTLIVSGNSLNLRAGAGTSYNVVAGLVKGEKVTLLASKPGWHQVKTAQGVVGWASVSYLGTTATPTVTVKPAATATKPAATAARVRVTGKSVNLRQSPSASSPVAGQCKQGDLLTWQNTLPGWYQVTNLAGKTVYISNTMAVLIKPAAVTAPTAPIPAAATKTPNQVQVTGSSVNLRQSPSTSAALAGSCKQGELLTWQKTLPGWYQVTTTAGKTVYISSSLAVLKPAATAPAASKPGTTAGNTAPAPITPPTAGTSVERAGKLQVTGSGVNLRSGPGTTYAVVGKVNKDQVLFAVNQTDGWYEVAAAGDERAWIIGSLVRMITPLAAAGDNDTTTTTPPVATAPDPPATGTTPSRGDDIRPELKPVTISSGEDYLGDFVSMIGEMGVEPAVNTEGNTLRITFPNSKLGTGGLPTRINISEDKSLGFDLTASSRDTSLEIVVKLPAGLKNSVEQSGPRVTVRIVPQLISLAPVTIANGREAVELRATHSLTVQELSDSGQPATRWKLVGITLNDKVEQSSGDAYDRIELNQAGAGTAEASVELKTGNLCDLIKVRSDIYRFYFRPIPKPGQPVTVMVDPGHGGSETGAIYYNTQEKKFNLAMGLKLGQTLEQAGYRVLYTRTSDSLITLNERVAIANAEKPDLYVSIHCNAMANSPTVSGTTTYYWPGDEPYLAAQRKQLATALQQGLISSLGTVNKGVRSDQFVVIKYTTMPSALVETMFMSNQQDFERLQSEDVQWQVARGIADGISSYLTGKGIALPALQAVPAASRSVSQESNNQNYQSPGGWYLP